ncbi:MAG TPA: hypothetical protein VN633_11075 [Bryobacteraceae bacterium]|nr:hypothetical protein [Bryobacteraceae bacterium]
MLLPTLRAADTWRRAESEHFVFYTNYGSRATRSYLKTLESARDFFHTLHPEATLPAEPVVLAVKSEKQFDQFRSIRNSIGECYSDGTRSFLVFTNLDLEPKINLLHEYAHCVLNYTQPSLPWWLATGLEELYSSMTDRGSRASIGRTLISRESRAWADDFMFIDLRNIFSTTPATMNDLSFTSQATAVSEMWALVHMLALSPEYADQFQIFVRRATEMPADIALISTYDKSVREMQAALIGYIDSGHWRRVEYEIPDIGKQLPRITFRPTDAASVERLTAQILGAKWTSMRHTQSLTFASIMPRDSTAE